MKKLRIYLDTSVISFLFADDAPEKRDVTREFFARLVYSCTADVYLSSVVLDELAETRDVGRRRQLLDVAHEITRLDIEPRAETIELAQAYIAHGAIPPGEYDDALHVATCSVHDIDVLVSWNFRHLANIKKEAQISAVNTLLGYRHVLRIITPHHLLYHE